MKIDELLPKNSMFINCFYTYGNYKTKEKDSVIIVYKDKNNKKDFVYLEEPEYTYYVTKDINKQYSYCPSGYEYRYISLDEVKEVSTKYSDRYKSMANNTTRKEVKDFYKQCTKKGATAEDYKKLSNMHLFKEFHSSDINITDYYINKFCEKNDQEENLFALNISAFDIEVAGAEHVGFPNEDDAPCPVNAISYYNNVTNTLSIFLLYYDTETFKELMQKNIKQKVKEVKELYQPYFGDFKTKVVVCKNELALIKAFFDRVNEDKPDYCAAWNARFDLFTLKNRLDKILVGTDISCEDIMCPSEFPVKKVILKKDTSEKAKKDFSARTDTYNIYGYTVWIDMMVLYANITRPYGKKESYQLNDIGLEETGLQKENLSEDDTSIKTVYLDNYTLFFKYSCIDTLLLMLIIKNTDYISLLHTIATMTRTRPIKALTKTVSLRNYIDVFYRENGYVISNNRSSLHNFNGKTSIDGAYVALVQLIDKIGKINGLPSNKCFDLVIDEDLSSMYPNIIIVFNISSSTADLKITIKKKTGKFETVVKNGKTYNKEILEDVTKDFMEKYLSDDIVSYCHEFHNLPDYNEMYNEFKEMIV